MAPLSRESEEDGRALLRWWSKAPSWHGHGGAVIVLLSGEYHGLVMPYLRMTHAGRFTPRAKRYHRSQNRIIAHMRDQLMAAALKEYALGRVVITVPFRFDLTIFVPPTKAGLVPKDQGDADNFLKAWIDAAGYGKIIKQDNLYWYRGGELDVHQCDAWRFVWRFRRVQ